MQEILENFLLGDFIMAYRPHFQPKELYPPNPLGKEISLWHAAQKQHAHPQKAGLLWGESPSNVNKFVSLTQSMRVTIGQHLAYSLATADFSVLGVEPRSALAT